VRHLGFDRQWILTSFYTHGADFSNCDGFVRPQYAPKTKFIITSADGLFLLPVPVLIMRLPKESHTAPAYQISVISGNARWKYFGDIFIRQMFNMAVARHTGLLFLHGILDTTLLW